MQFSQAREEPPAEASSGGSGRFMPLAIGLLLAVAVLLFWRRSRKESVARKRRLEVGRGVAAAAGVLCIGMALLLGWTLLEPFFRFQEAPCRVLDRRIMTKEFRPDSSRYRQRSTYGVPLAAVQMEMGEERLITAGFATGMATRSVQELRTRPIGTETTCWFDPRDPHRFTLVRAPSAGGIVGLGMLLFTAAVALAIARRLGVDSSDRRN